MQLFTYSSEIKSQIKNKNKNVKEERKKIMHMLDDDVEEIQ